MSTAAPVVVTAPRARSTSVTTGLKAAETGCRARIRATRTTPVIRLFEQLQASVTGGEALGGDARADDGGDEERCADELGGCLAG